MVPPSQKYKTIKHYHEPGDFHELTFSCYRQLPLLTNDDWRRKLAQSVDRAMVRWKFHLHAFVFMPEHLHLLVYPFGCDLDPPIDALLKAIKRPYSFRIKRILIENNSRLLAKLTVRDGAEPAVFRYWQEGPGYDRNLHGPVGAGCNRLHTSKSRAARPLRARRPMEVVEREMVPFRRRGPRRRPAPHRSAAVGTVRCLTSNMVALVALPTSACNAERRPISNLRHSNSVPTNLLASSAWLRPSRSNENHALASFG